MYEGNHTVHFCEPSIRLTVYLQSVTILYNNAE